MFLNNQGPFAGFQHYLGDNLREFQQQQQQQQKNTKINQQKLTKNNRPHWHCFVSAMCHTKACNIFGLVFHSNNVVYSSITSSPSSASSLY